MFDKFTESARRAVFFSRYESSRVGQSLIGTEHLLLGLLRENDAIVSELLQQVSFNADDVRARYPAVVDRVSSSAELPLSENAKKVLAYAVHESALRQDSEVEPFHVALAILRVKDCRAALLLAERGLDYDVASEILRLLVPAVRRRIQIDERTPIVLRESHYEALDLLAQTAGLNGTPRANRERLALAVMDALHAAGVPEWPVSSLEEFQNQLRSKLA